jgi:predicted ATPase
MSKEIAQLGAVLGRVFSYDVLQALAMVDESPLQEGLAQLVEAELLYQRGRPPRARYIFKHALIQDAAYQTLLKSTRQQYHRRIVETLESRFPQTVQSDPELLAHHCTEAGLVERAIDYWYEAGTRAGQRSAYVEAARHLHTGLTLIPSLPDGTPRIQRELDLHLALGVIVIATRGHSDPEVARIYNRARELCQQVGEPPELIQTLHGLQRFFLVSGNIRTAYDIGVQMVALGQRIADATMLIDIYGRQGHVFFHQGNFTSARQHLEQSLALYDRQQHAVYVARSGNDPGVSALIRLAITLWFLGYPDQAMQKGEEALRLARDLSHPFALIWVLCFMTWLYHYQGDIASIQACADAAFALATEHCIKLRVADSTIMQGWVMSMQGHHEIGLARIQQGVEHWKALGAGLDRPYHHGLLAEAFNQAGQYGQALESVAEGLDITARQDERFWEAELLRLRGLYAATMSSHRTRQAEADFKTAFSIARSQHAKSLELRAATSLARLWQSQDKRQDAYDLLAPVYGWFTEGFDTADLKDAKALLAELQG